MPTALHSSKVLSRLSRPFAPFVFQTPAPHPPCFFVWFVCFVVKSSARTPAPQGLSRAQAEIHPGRTRRAGGGSPGFGREGGRTCESIRRLRKAFPLDWLAIGKGYASWVS